MVPVAIEGKGKPMGVGVGGCLGWSFWEEGRVKMHPEPGPCFKSEDQRCPELQQSLGAQKRCSDTDGSPPCISMDGAISSVVKRHQLWRNVKL
jgi:hypothetical protein